MFIGLIKIEIKIEVNKYAFNWLLYVVRLIFNSNFEKKLIFNLLYIKLTNMVTKNYPQNFIFNPNWLKFLTFNLQKQ